jgi:hypothetical protein
VPVTIKRRTASTVSFAQVVDAALLVLLEETVVLAPGSIVLVLVNVAASIYVAPAIVVPTIVVAGKIDPETVLAEMVVGNTVKGESVVGPVMV